MTEVIDYLIEVLGNFLEAHGWASLVALMYLGWMLYILVHEAGHLLMAILLKTRVNTYQCGAPGIYRFTVRGIDFRIGPLPWGKVNYAYDDDALRWKVMVTALAGPLLPVLVTVLMWGIMSDKYLFYWVWSFFLILGTVTNLNPFQENSDGYKVFKHIYMILKGKKNLDME